MVNLDEICAVMQCNDDTARSNDMSIYIGFAMLFVGEILPFLGVEANGFLHLLTNLLKK